MTPQNKLKLKDVDPKDPTGYWHVYKGKTHIAAIHKESRLVTWMSPIVGWEIVDEMSRILHSIDQVRYQMSRSKK